MEPPPIYSYEILRRLYLICQRGTEYDDFVKMLRDAINSRLEGFANPTSRQGGKNKNQRNSATHVIIADLKTFLDGLPRSPITASQPSQNDSAQPQGADESDKSEVMDSSQRMLDGEATDDDNQTRDHSAISSNKVDQESDGHSQDGEIPKGMVEKSDGVVCADANKSMIKTFNKHNENDPKDTSDLGSLSEKGEGPERQNEARERPSKRHKGHETSRNLAVVPPLIGTFLLEKLGLHYID